MPNCVDIADQPNQPGTRLADSETLRIGPVRTTNQGHRVEAEFQIGAQPHRVYFQSEDITLGDNLEACVVGALVPAMTKGGSLEVPGPVSQRLLAAVPTIVDIFTSWYPALRPVAIQDAIPVNRDAAAGQRVGVFFSGGVDSFYTFLKRREEITHLIFVHGFDVRLEDAPLRRMTSEMVRRVASRFGKGVVEVETNLRLLLDPYAHWRDQTHGAALATIGHLLTGSFGRIYISAAYSYAGLLPNGTHPLLDPLWSTEALDLVHDGCEASRLDKVAFISQHEVALENLRVCWKNPNGAYNCGRCEKCMRTMISLHVVDALDRCATFDQPLDPKRVRRMVVPDAHRRTYLEEMLKILEGKPDDLGICQALRRVINRPQWSIRLEDCLKRILARCPRLYSVLRSARDRCQLRTARPPRASR